MILSTISLALDNGNNIPKYKKNRKCHSKFGNNIAVFNKKCFADPGIGDTELDCRDRIVCLGIDHDSGRVDKAGDAGIGAPCHPAAGFDATESCIIFMLPETTGISPPAVVGNNGDQVCSV